MIHRNGHTTSLPINEDTQLFTILLMQKNSINRLMNLVNSALNENANEYDKRRAGLHIFEEQKYLGFLKSAATHYYN